LRIEVAKQKMKLTKEKKEVPEEIELLKLVGKYDAVIFNPIG